MGTTMGVEVTVCVTMAPEIVTTRTLVTGDGVSEAVIELLDASVVAGTGATTGAIVLLDVCAYDVEDEYELEYVDVLGASVLEVEAGVCATKWSASLNHHRFVEGKFWWEYANSHVA